MRLPYAPFSAGALHISNSEVILINTQVTRSSATLGGAIAVDLASSMYIEDVTLGRNTATVGSDLYIGTLSGDAEKTAGKLVGGS